MDLKMKMHWEVLPSMAAKNSQKDRQRTASNYTIELTAIDLALNIIKYSRSNKFVICTDSKSSLEVLQNKKNMRNPLIIKLSDRINLCNIKTIICWILSRVGICGNKKVDKATNRSLYSIKTNTKIPYTDLKPIINRFITNKWQTLWDNGTNNKLKKIQPMIKTYQSYRKVRKEEVTLARLQIGHTYITHSYLLEGEAPPFGVGCHAPFTLEHILMKCIDFNEICSKHYQVDNLKDFFFEQVNPNNIFGFLKEVWLYQKI